VVGTMPVAGGAGDRADDRRAAGRVGFQINVLYLAARFPYRAGELFPVVSRPYNALVGQS